MFERQFSGDFFHTEKWIFVFRAFQEFFQIISSFCIWHTFHDYILKPVSLSFARIIEIKIYDFAYTFKTLSQVWFIYDKVCIFRACTYVTKIIFFSNSYRFKPLSKHELTRDITNFHESEHPTHIFYLKNKGL